MPAAEPVEVSYSYAHEGEPFREKPGKPLSACAARRRGSRVAESKRPQTSPGACCGRRGGQGDHLRPADLAAGAGRDRTEHSAAVRNGHQTDSVGAPHLIESEVVDGSKKECP